MRPAITSAVLLLVCVGLAGTVVAQQTDDEFGEVWMVTPLLAQQSYGGVSTWLDKLLDDDVLPFILGMVAILAGTSIVISRNFMKHRERVELIRQGFHPEDGRFPDDGTK